MPRLARILLGEDAIEVSEQLTRRRRRAGICVRDRVRHRHQHRGRRSVTAHVGDQDSPFAFGQRKEIVIVAAGSLRRLIVGRQTQVGIVGNGDGNSER